MSDEDYVDVSAEYAAYPRRQVADLPKGSHLNIGDLIKTHEGRILIPHGPDEANLFAVYGDDPTSVVGEFATYSDAEDFCINCVGILGMVYDSWGDMLAPVFAAMERAEDDDA